MATPWSSWPPSANGDGGKGGVGVSGGGVGGSALPAAAAAADDVTPDATELARWTRVMTPAPPVALLPGNPLRDRLDALPAEEREWLLPCSLWEPPPLPSSLACADMGRAVDGGVTPVLGPFSPSAFATAVCRERVMTTTAGGVPFLVLAGVTLFLPHAVAAGSGALLGAMVNDWSANRMDAVGPGLPSCVSIVQRGVLAAAGRGMISSAELGGGTHVLMEFARAVGGDLADGASIEFEFLVIRRPRVVGETAAVVLHKLGVLHTIPDVGSPYVAAAVDTVEGATGTPAVAPFSSVVTPGAVGIAAHPTTVEARILELCADGQHIGALVDLAVPPSPLPPAAAGEVTAPPQPPVLPYTVTTSRCSVYASVRLRTLALQLVPLAVPSVRPLRMSGGGRQGGGKGGVPACSSRLVQIAPAASTTVTPSRGDVRTATCSDEVGGRSGSGSSSGSGGGDMNVCGNSGCKRPRWARRVTTRPLPLTATAVTIAPALNPTGLDLAIAAAAEAAIESGSVGKTTASATTSLLPRPPQSSEVVPPVGGASSSAGGVSGGSGGSDGGGGGRAETPRWRVRRRRLGSAPPPGVDGGGDAWARVLRNREAARRSNEKRRLRRLAAAAASSAAGVGAGPASATATTSLGMAATKPTTELTVSTTGSIAAAAAAATPLMSIRLPAQTPLPQTVAAPPPASAWGYGGHV
ncbi:hypothetical protein MMPV_004116 [Pyropia vietnamensis]